MKIVIIGANQVGSALAETLSNEKNDITIVDENSERLQELNDHIDAGWLPALPRIRLLC